ncbi:cytochrome P450 [Mycolicibacterium fortuitum subsp. acetamidolyticum]|uniref:Cytochrome P450 n=1 Tax=Mycolicibacterium fortuitum subsp. acetamidolyticum TaxID=144550 RepID=A0A100WQ99_MYCFO|nr:cytochrome P450 [Mycolicibacterium fortuitum subsp. acetamidolyticum]
MRGLGGREYQSRLIDQRRTRPGKRAMHRVRGWVSLEYFGDTLTGVDRFTVRVLCRGLRS